MSVSLTTARGEGLERDRSPPKGSRHRERDIYHRERRPNEDDDDLDSVV